MIKNVDFINDQSQVETFFKAIKIVKIGRIYNNFK